MIKYLKYKKEKKMKNIELIIPKLEEYSYEQKLESEPKTKINNTGNKVMFNG